jgi:hypothetical protein
MKSVSKYVAVSLFAVISTGLIAQDKVPLGIHYQAVARDNYGNELVNRKISVRFSIIKDDPLGEVVYQELFLDILTSRFGVFSLVIGHGTPTGNSPCGELSQISWESAFHFLKVEVKFENDYMDMGTMQFLAVPYALYARKSLEPGPAGPKGDAGPKGEPGDPASDDQTLSFDGSSLSIGGGNSLSLTDLLQNLTVAYQADGTYLGISRGNSVKLATIEADGDPKNELQDLTISSDKLKITNNTLATEWDLSPYRQSLLWDPSARIISISGTNSTVNLSELENDADADAANEIQDIALSGDLLTITKNPSSAGVSLVKYLDDTDRQQLGFNTSDNILSLTNSTSVDLTSLKNDADFDITNEIQDLELTGDLLKITKNSSSAGVNLNKYLDDTDNQQLDFNSVNNTLILTGNDPVDLSSLENDADADATNEIQDLQLIGNKLSITGKTGAFELNMATYLDDTDDQGLTFTETDLLKTISISGGNSVDIDNKVAFRVKNISSDIASINSYPILKYDSEEYNSGNYLNLSEGIFTVPVNGIYTFNVTYLADGSGDGREVSIYVNYSLYEKLAISISSGSTVPVKSITLKLNADDIVSVVVYTGLASQTGTGSFSGYKVN